MTHGIYHVWCTDIVLDHKMQLVGICCGGCVPAVVLEDKMKRYKEDDRVLVNYQKMFRIIEKRGLNQSTVSAAIGKSPAYIGAMYSKDGKMLYGDLIKIARILYIHGATKLVRKEDDKQINEDIIAEMKANMTSEERIAEALETIAGLLLELLEAKQ